MLQNTRNRLVAPGLRSPAGLEALAFEPWHDLTREMDRLVSSVLRADAASADGAEPLTAWVPAVDVEEREDAVRLAFEVPGVDPDALDVTVNDRVLTVSGERRFVRPEGETGRSAYRLERRYGRFARSLTLPKTVDPDRIQARYEHGVLHLELPKRPEAQPRRIAIAAGPSGAGSPEPRRLDAGRADAGRADAGRADAGRADADPAQA
jgi:HSP20 family protein